jgi:hypothetical protein
MDCEALCRRLRAKQYQASFFSSGAQARAYLLREIGGRSVGFGDSLTLRQLGLADALAARGQVFDPAGARDDAAFYALAGQAMTAEVFLTSANALARTGEMVNIDAVGNRLAGSLFGHQKVYFVVGTNKIAASLEKAVERARNVAAPQNAARLGCRTPCAKAPAPGGCADCGSPERICRALLIYFQKMQGADAEVVLIDEPLGL